MKSGQITEINFYFQDVSPSLRNRRQLKIFLASVFRSERRNFRALNYIFCTDQFLLAMNRKYLKRSYLTDVITFDLSDKGDRTTAEIYISPERVKANAKRFSQLYSHELIRVMVHGALHLCGYDDSSAAEQIRMRRREDYHLKRFFVKFHGNQFR